MSFIFSFSKNKVLSLENGKKPSILLQIKGTPLHTASIIEMGKPSNLEGANTKSAIERYSLISEMTPTSLKYGFPKHPENLLPYFANFLKKILYRVL